MAYYPVFLDLRGRRAVVVGGGAVAATKIAGLLRADAVVTVIAPGACDEVRALAAAGRIRLEPRGYAAGDLDGARIVIAATDDRSVNHAVAAEAARRGALANVVDDPAASHFIAPAVVERGDLQIAISTGGASPALAVYLKDRIAGWIGPEYAAALVVLRSLRGVLRARGWSMTARRDAIRALAEAGLVERVRDRDHAGVDELLGRIVGRGVTLAELGVGLG